VFFLALVWAVVLSRFAIMRHLAIKTSFDLGFFSQIMWATTRGALFYQSLMENSTNALSGHFFPLLIVLAPIYGIWPDARMLLVLQAVILASAAIPLFAFARRRLGSPLALVVVLSYLLSPLPQNIALADFHEIALAVPLLMAAGGALLDKRLRATLIWIALALLVKEEVTLIAAGFSLYMLLIQRRWRAGAFAGIGTVVWAVVLVKWLMPGWSANGGGSNLAQHYGILGGTPLEILRSIVFRPASVLQVVLTEHKWLFLLQLLAPLAGLPILGLPALLLALPTLAYLLLGGDTTLVSIRHHYSAALLPFLFLSTAWALQRLRTWHPAAGRTAAFALLLATALGLWRWSPLPIGRAYLASDFVVSSETQATRQLLSSIPPTASVAADAPFQPWLANRWLLADILTPPFVQFEPPIQPDYVVARTPGDYAVTDPVYPWLIQDTGAKLLAVPRFVSVGRAPDATEVWKRQGSDRDVMLHRYDASFSRGLTLVAAGTPPEGPAWDGTLIVGKGAVVPIWLAWSAKNRLDQKIAFSLHLVDSQNRIVAQVDQEMGAGRFATTLWHTWLNNPVLVSEFLLDVPSDIPDGSYTLLAGAFESATITTLVRPDGEAWLTLALVKPSP